MKRYWDSSALVDAILDSRVEVLAREPDQYTRSHTLTEVFSTITGGRLPFRFNPADASAIIDELTATMKFVDLNTSEIRKALGQTEARGVRGGQVHDWLHAVAAKKAGVEQLLTDNLTDFAALADGFTIEVP